jgi:DNA processing protein
MNLSNASRLLAVAEALCPYVNGPKADRLADAVELAGEECVESGEFEVLDMGDGGRIAAAFCEIDSARVVHWREQLIRLSADGVRLITVADEDYPVNLRMIHNRPPFIFVRGDIRASDRRAVAVVGTRNPSDEGIRIAHELAGELAKRDVTVVSGLAKGIDTAAHVGALARGGRTIAVFGTGIEKTFPAQNRALAKAVSDSGACVSQFFPAQGGAKWTFPVRNVVTSGLSVGTIVVEAGPTSGARLQSEEAIRHGKRLFLMRHLVESQQWARTMADRPEVQAVTSTEEVIDAIEVDLEPRREVLI